MPPDVVEEETFEEVYQFTLEAGEVAVILDSLEVYLAYLQERQVDMTNSEDLDACIAAYVFVRYVRQRIDAAFKGGNVDDVIIG